MSFDYIPVDTPAIACSLIQFQHRQWVKTALSQEDFTNFDERKLEVDFLLSYRGEGEGFRDRLLDIIEKDPMYSEEFWQNGGLYIN